MIRRSWVVTALTVTLCGCGEVAYKMGGGTDAYRHDQATCHNDSDDAYKICMKSRGWTVVGSATPATSESTAATAAPVTDHSMHAAPDVTPKIAAQKAEVSAPPTDPNASTTVTSWWKFGATDFKGDSHACTESLGSMHRYDEIKHVTTRAFVDCMARKGWHAL